MTDLLFAAAMLSVAAAGTLVALEVVTVKKAFFAIVVILSFLFVPMFIGAQSLSWENTNPADVAVDGTTIYFSATDGTDPATGEFIANVPMGVYTWAIPEINLVPGKQYQFQAAFYNSADESLRTEPVYFTAGGYTPPEDSLPTAIYTAPGVPVTITIQP